MTKNFLIAAGLLAAALSLSAQEAPVQVERAWARASVPGQSGTGAFMTLTAREPLQLVGALTPMAAMAEVHEMRMEGDVMRMRPVAGLALPAGQPVELKPGGYHLMLTGLHGPLKDGTQLPLTLQFRDAKGAVRTLQLSLPVALRAPAAAGQGSHGGHGKHGSHGSHGTGGSHDSHR